MVGHGDSPELLTGQLEWHQDNDILLSGEVSFKSIKEADIAFLRARLSEVSSADDYIRLVGTLNFGAIIDFTLPNLILNDRTIAMINLVDISSGELSTQPQIIFSSSLGGYDNFMPKSDIIKTRLKFGLIESQVNPANLRKINMAIYLFLRQLLVVPLYFVRDQYLDKQLLERRKRLYTRVLSDLRALAGTDFNVSDRWVYHTEKAIAVYLFKQMKFTQMLGRTGDQKYILDIKAVEDSCFECIYFLRKLVQVNPKIKLYYSATQKYMQPSFSPMSRQLCEAITTAVLVWRQEGTEFTPDSSDNVIVRRRRTRPPTLDGTLIFLIYGQHTE